MKLSEALALRADLNKQIAAVTQRMIDNAKVQQGDNPAEDSEALLARLDGMALQLEGLIKNINKTNLSVFLPDGRSLTEAIAARDILLIRIGYYRKLADHAVIKQSVQTRSEVKFVSQVNVGSLREAIDQLAKEHRTVDTAIQTANWTFDIIED